MADTPQPLHAHILSTAGLPQAESPLFGIVPAEVRSLIFALALADHPDPSPDKHYGAQTCYSRPAYFAPRKSDSRLLRTCRAIYRETWFMPFLLREQTHWLGNQERAPPEYIVHRQRPALRDSLEQICQQQATEEVEIEALRVFAQMWALENGSLRALLETPRLRPRTLTLTIRHTDWWFWEVEQPLRFEGNWLRDVGRAMPSSLTMVRIELESLEQKKEQVDAIAKQMSERWFFKRGDGVALYPDTSGQAIEIDRWTGSSTWHNHTWTRDEARPGEIDYYIASVVFQLAPSVEKRGGTISEAATSAAESNLFTSKLRLQWVDAESRSYHSSDGDEENGAPWGPEWDESEDGEWDSEEAGE